MYVDSIKENFYEFISGKRICLMVHYDVDGICACKILQSLLVHNQTVYTLAVIEGVSDLKNVFREHCNNVKYFVLINCGGTFDIVELLEPDDDIIFFILDSHRPTNLHNLYSISQIRLLWNPDEDSEVPEYHSVFRDDESEDSFDDSGGSDDEDGQSSKKRRLGEEEILKRRELRLWESNRERILFDYTKYSYYSRASALYMFNLAWKLSRDDKDLLWYTIVAITEQLIFEKIERTQYILETSNLQEHANRLQYRSNDANNATSVKIKYQQDLKLALYRHWSIESSIKYSMSTACKLKLWSIKGDARLNELLAEMGFPLVQSRQNYVTMDLQLKEEFFGAIEKVSEKYNLTDLIYTTFTLKYGFKNKYCAWDVAFGMLAQLEASDLEKSPDECFQKALDCLSRTHNSSLNVAIEMGKDISKNLFRTVQSALDMKKIISAGPFIYYLVLEGSQDWSLYSHPHVLNLLAQFILHAYVAMSRNTSKASRLPLIVSAPKNVPEGNCIIHGISPLADNTNKNFFGKAFEEAAVQINCESSGNYFDTSYTDIAIKDRTRFLDALTALLG